MVNLNYNHLYYFWVVATVGSIAHAARSLHVTPQTISGQLRTLEERLGSALFERVGRKLALTETGKVVHSYVDPMFGLGLELGDVLDQRAPPRIGPLSVGVATGIEKSLACRMLLPAMDVAISARMLCQEAGSEMLVSALLAREIDLAVTDTVVQSTHAANLRSHFVGQSTVTLFGAAAVAERYGAPFPAALTGAPIVMPPRKSTVAKALAEWFRREQVTPSIVAEIDSPDLGIAVAEAHSALLVLPTLIAHDVERRYRVSAVGEVSCVVQNFYIVSTDSPRRQAGILAVVEGAREALRAATVAANVTECTTDSWRARCALPRSA